MKKLVTVLFVVLLLPLAATAAPISAVFAFGDSLSDGGNAYVISGGDYPPSPPYAQRFSNGPTAVERMAAVFGVDLQPSVGGRDELRDRRRGDGPRADAARRPGPRPDEQLRDDVRRAVLAGVRGAGD